MEANSTTSHDALNTGDLTTRGQRDIADLIIMQQKLALLPAREIAVFNGDPLTYQSFMRAFEYLVEDKTSSSQDRLYFLEQYTSDQPRDLVRSCLNMDARQGYAEAKRLLKKHFGNEVMVTNAYLEKALSWTAIKADDGKALQAYALYLRGCYIAMQDLEYLKELDIPSNLRLMTSKLPYKLRDKWRTAAHDTMELHAGNCACPSQSDEGNKSVLTYAFLDPGSSATFCTENLMNRLHAKGRKTEILLRTMGQERLVKSYGLTGLEVTNLEGTTHLNLPRVYTQDRIPVSKENIPTQNDLEKWPYLSGIQLDEIDADIDLLIGINVPKAMEPWHTINSQENGPYAVKTLLGWVVNGPLNTCTAMDVSGPPAMMANRISIANLGELIIRQYNQDFSEREYEEKSEMSGEDKKFMEIASSSITLQDGHYHLALPLRDKDVVMPDNHDMAEQRTMNLLKRFRKDESYALEYKAFMDDVIGKGYAEKVPQEQLHGMTARFRQEQIAVMGDIEAMFYQVRVHDNHRDFLRFLWWLGGDTSKPLEVYRMKVHLFGAVSSPSIANFALQRTADDNTERYDEEITETIKRNFYVDDCLKSVPTAEQAIQLTKDLKDACFQGGFVLTKFVSNSREVLASIPEEHKGKPVKEMDLDKEQPPIERALGIHWNIESDMFIFRVTIKSRPLQREGSSQSSARSTIPLVSFARSF
ncbi:hypothetical protein AAFF_G00083590 [Aldrovandia affinis]|uniref:Uncharacterized protein n=1 Tax=Aldrovandia affinis TaxID=143900 RepID=A0AAD7WCQ4_9TELE|nr:hypothetical protein AAFF_G00083590 [Aldrovandia affinis]